MSLLKRQETPASSYTWLSSPALLAISRKEDAMRVLHTLPFTAIQETCSLRTKVMSEQSDWWTVDDTRQHRSSAFFRTVTLLKLSSPFVFSVLAHGIYWEIVMCCTHSWGHISGQNRTPVLRLIHSNWLLDIQMNEWKNKHQNGEQEDYTASGVYQWRLGKWEEDEAKPVSPQLKAEWLRWKGQPVFSSYPFLYH